MQATEAHQLTQQVWSRHRAAPDPALREWLIVQYAPLVKYVVGRMAVSLPGLRGTEDVLSYGTIGLIQAVDRYDPTVGVKFETYAIRRIRGSILDAVRGLQATSRHAGRRARELEHAYDDLVQRLGRLPEDGEVAEHLGLSMDELRATLAEASTTVVSLDRPIGEVVDGERTSLIDQLADESRPGVSDQAERRTLRGALARAIEQLPERDRLVVTLYYQEELTLREIGEVLDVSISRVDRLHWAAVFKLRKALRAELAPKIAS